MQQAAIPGYRLARARQSTRVLTTLGLMGLLAGLLSAALLTLSRTGLSATSVSHYYRGAPAGSDDLGVLFSTTGRSLGELAEVTHLHLVGGSMLLFFLCHLLSVCEVSERWRTIIYLVSFGTFLSTFSLPWLIAYVSELFSYAFGPSIIAFLCSLSVLTVVPLWEMWWREDR